MMNPTVKEISGDGINLSLEIPQRSKVLLNKADEQLRGLSCVADAERMLRKEKDYSEMWVYEVEPARSVEITTEETNWPRVNGMPVRMMSEPAKDHVRVTLETVPGK